MDYCATIHGMALARVAAISAALKLGNGWHLSASPRRLQRLRSGSRNQNVVGNPDAGTKSSSFDIVTGQAICFMHRFSLNIGRVMLRVWLTSAGGQPTVWSRQRANRTLNTLPRHRDHPYATGGISANGDAGHELRA